MLFLYRPPQTRMSFTRPQAAAQQAGYQATRRVPLPPPPPPASPIEKALPSKDLVEQLTQLGELHASGVLSDEEFAAFKAKLLAR